MCVFFFKYMHVHIYKTYIHNIVFTHIVCVLCAGSSMHSAFAEHIGFNIFFFGRNVFRGIILVFWHSFKSQYLVAIKKNLKKNAGRKVQRRAWEYIYKCISKFNVIVNVINSIFGLLQLFISRHLIAKNHFAAATQTLTWHQMMLFP